MYVSDKEKSKIQIFRLTCAGNTEEKKVTQKSTISEASGNDVDIKAKHEIKVGFGDARGFDGKVTLHLTNVDQDKLLLKKTVNLGKINKNDCVGVTFECDPKGSHNGDELIAKAIGGGSSWESAPEN